MSPDHEAQSLLRWSLRGNGAFSALSGLACVAAATPLARALGVPDPLWLAGTGVNLLGFAAALAFVASRPVLHLPTVWTVVALDLAWVAGTVPLVLADVLTRAGNAAAVVVADVVLLFAVLQYLGIRRVAGAQRHRAWA